MAERKKFIDVNVPILGKEIQVLGTPKELDRRTVKLDLSRKLRGKGVIITLQIFNREERLVAIPKKIEIMKSYLRRIIRKRTDNVEDSFVAQCLDVNAVVKPFLITRKRVSRAVRKNLRNTAREFLLGYLKEKSYNEACSDILSGSLQKAMLPKLKKVYPLAFCDVRVFETKDLTKINLDEIVDVDETVRDADTPEVEEALEEEIEEEVIDEAIEEAESDEESDEEMGDEEDARKK